jgi:hypothetical protein
MKTIQDYSYRELQVALRLYRDAGIVLNVSLNDNALALMDELYRIEAEGAEIVEEVAQDDAVEPDNEDAVVAPENNEDYVVVGDAIVCEVVAIDGDDGNDIDGFLFKVSINNETRLVHFESVPGTCWYESNTHAVTVTYQSTKLPGAVSESLKLYYKYDSSYGNNPRDFNSCVTTIIDLYVNADGSDTDIIKCVWNKPSRHNPPVRIASDINGSRIIVDGRYDLGINGKYDEASGRFVSAVTDAVASYWNKEYELRVHFLIKSEWAWDIDSWKFTPPHAFTSQDCEYDYCTLLDKQSTLRYRYQKGVVCRNVCDLLFFGSDAPLWRIEGTHFNGTLQIVDVICCKEGNGTLLHQLASFPMLSMAPITLCWNGLDDTTENITENEDGDIGGCADTVFFPDCDFHASF